MDEISRELPSDATTPATGASAPVSGRDRTKGPDELVTQDRGQTDADLVVRNRFEPSAVDFAVAMHPADPISTPLPESATPGPASPGPASPEPTRSASPPPVAAAAITPAAESEIDAAAAAAAVAAEAEVVEIEEELLGEDAEGLPAVPELADAAAVAKVVFVLMLTSRDGLSMLRLAQACNTTQKLVDEGLGLLQRQLRELGLPVELARTGDTVKWMSGPDSFPYLQRLRGVKKLEKLSPAALETLAVIAYRQPVMRSEIEAIRGVKAGPMLRTLLQHKLVTCTGRADVPGRPLQYGTTQQFLERFGIGTLQELPSLKEWKNLG